MNKFQKMMSVTLVGCMAASALMMSAGAVNVQNDTTSSAPVTAAQSVRRVVTPSTTVKLNTNSSNQIVPWSVYSGYGYWKIHVINNSKSMMTVKIHTFLRAMSCRFTAQMVARCLPVHTIWIFPPTAPTI